MFDYKNFSANDFAMDAFFREWVLKPTPDASAFWKNWLWQNPEKSEVIEKARKIVITLKNAQEEISEDEIDMAVAQIVAAANQRGAQPKPVIRPIWSSTNMIRWAASIIAVLGLTWYAYDYWGNRPSELYTQTVATVVSNPKMLETFNKSSEPMVITLPDGSSVILQPKSRISYPAQFEDSVRAVVLSGEAFFEVAKNPQQPFLVYANELITKVLGTSFTIKAFANDSQVKVIVKTGKVWVYTAKDAQRPQAIEATAQATLIPNQQITLLREKLALQKANVSAQMMRELPSIQTQSFEFKHTPLSEVFQMLESTYHVEIDYDQQLMSACELTASLGDEPLPEKLKLICSVIEATYEVQEGKVVIHGKACN
jgi:ferric-dicitrate binding protein FerR (iron transport regulator)